jgi:hypothetical protein
MSTDGSRATVERLSRGWPLIRTISNPRRFTAPAMNIGIRQARGDVIVCTGAHATYASDYLRQCVSLLAETGAGSVGGVIGNVGEGLVGGAIALATSVPFGIGDSAYRHARHDQWTDSVFGGAWPRAVVEQLGGFDEAWVRNADYEFHFRLRQAGFGVFLSPRIRCRYYVRQSVQKLIGQYFRYGYWKVKTLVAHPDSLRGRQLAAPALVTALVLSGLLAPVHAVVPWLVPAAYAVTCVAVSVSVGARHGWRLVPVLAVVFPVIHLSWGAGFLAGLGRFGVPRCKWAGLGQAFRPLTGPTQGKAPGPTRLAAGEVPAKNRAGRGTDGAAAAGVDSEHGPGSDRHPDHAAPGQG